MTNLFDPRPLSDEEREILAGDPTTLDPETVGRVVFLSTNTELSEMDRERFKRVAAAYRVAHPTPALEPLTDAEKRSIEMNKLRGEERYERMKKQREQGLVQPFLPPTGGDAA